MRQKSGTDADAARAEVEIGSRITNMLDRQRLGRTWKRKNPPRGDRGGLRQRFIPLGLVGRFLPETPALRGSSGRRLRAQSGKGKSLTLSTTVRLQLDKFGKLIAFTDEFFVQIRQKVQILTV
jgi:hypothetical protein